MCIQGKGDACPHPLKQTQASIYNAYTCERKKSFRCVQNDPTAALPEVKKKPSTQRRQASAPLRLLAFCLSFAVSSISLPLFTRGLAARVRIQGSTGSRGFLSSMRF